MAWVWEAKIAHAIHLKLYRLNDPPAFGETGLFTEASVKCLVKLKEKIAVPVGDGDFLLREIGFDGGQELWRALPGQTPDDGNLQGFTYELRFLYIFDSDRCDETSALRQYVDQPFVGKADQCLADRCSADTQLQ